jgi:hypothetical protein
MTVFVVLVDAMGGEQLIGTSPTHGEALERLREVTFGANSRVREVPVLSAQPEPKMVYTAEYYERGLDVHYFEGVYGNKEAARRSVGKDGLVIPREI